MAKGGGMEDYVGLLFGLGFGLLIGLAVGVVTEARKWREKGDHEYMNRMASGGHLYQVKRER